jgi:outer membrane protein OmpA-like peptidoglycan-associated protein
MVLLGSGGKPRDVRAFLQARRVLVPVACLAWLVGCANYHNRGPEAWYHEAVGGQVAAQRPPPPGDPLQYPNLATVPPRPASTDASAWNRITAGLITDRINAREAAALAPIPPATAGTGARQAASPLGFGPQQPSDQASASLVAATAPPLGPSRKPAATASTTQGANQAVPALPSSPGPAATGAGTPVAASMNQATAGTPAFNQPSSTSTAGGVAASAASADQSLPPVTMPPPGQMQPTNAQTAQRVAGGQLPALPSGEPARPGIAPPPPGSLIPVTASPPQEAAEINGTGVNFDHGSAALNDAALAEVKLLAQTRNGHGIAVTGFGDASTSAATGQSDALALGLARAQALATALVAQGVPFARLRLSAEASGRGANLRLLE